MNFSTFRQRLKPWMLPIAMILGVVLHNYIGYVAFLSKYLIFIMLLITYCRVKISDFRVGPYIWWLLAIQLLGSVAVYFLLLPFSKILAMGGFICIFCPTATAAPVVAGMLGGSVSRVATYSLFSHTSVAFLAPVILSWMAGSAESASFGTSLLSIATTVLPLILGPLAVALLMQRFSPRDHRFSHNIRSRMRDSVRHRTPDRKALRRCRVRRPKSWPEKHSARRMALPNLPRPYCFSGPGRLCRMAQHCQLLPDFPTRKAPHQSQITTISKVITRK